VIIAGNKQKENSLTITICPSLVIKSNNSPSIDDNLFNYCQSYNNIVYCFDCFKVIAGNKLAERIEEKRGWSVSKRKK